MKRILAGVLLAAAAVAACSDDSAPPATTGAGPVPTTAAPAPPSTEGGTESTPTTPPPTTAPPDGRIEDAAIALEVVARLEQPIALATRPPDGKVLWVAERTGRVRLVDPETGDVSAPVLDISSETVAEGERGLLGMAFTADGSELVISFTDRDGDSVVEAVAVDEQGAAGERRRLLDLEQPAPNHNGGSVVLGPDGMIYLGFGDGGGAGDPFGHGQDPGTLLGTILRIDPSGDPYAVPADNPFVDGGGAPEVWLYGVRNPWRFSFDRVTGDLWLGDVGQNRVEEIDLLPATGGAGRGANLGWPLMEGSSRFAGDPPPGHVGPVHEYGHDEGCSVTGGYVYRGRAVPALVGAYLFTDYCNSELQGLQVRDGEVVHRRFGIEPEGGSVFSFGEDAGGELYVLSASGSLSRVVAG